MTAQPDRRPRCKLKETWPILRRSGTSELIPEVRYKPIYRIAALYLDLNHPLRGSNSRLVSSKMPTARVIQRERMSRYLYAASLPRSWSAPSLQFVAWTVPFFLGSKQPDDPSCTPQTAIPRFPSRRMERYRKTVQPRIPGPVGNHAGARQWVLRHARVS